MIVHKFGGALARSKRGLQALVRIVSDVARRERARARRRAGDDGLVLVASAIGHTTRHLARAAELARDGKLREAEESLDRTLSQHEQLATSLRLEDRLFDRFEQITSETRALLEGVAIVRELSLRSRDAILANGERFATALIEALLKEHEIPVRFIDARKIILTDEQFGHAAPILEETVARVHRIIVPHLHRGEVVLTQGFAGATRDGVTTTMGSESSDLTATLLGAALEAEEVVIWKMVPGIFSADPELVPSARLVRSLTFDEAEEAGRRGARVLFQNFAHPITAREARTKIRIATPFTKTARQTVLEREITSNVRAQKPLTVVMEPGVIALSVANPGSFVATRLNKRSKDPLSELLARNNILWSSAGETTIVIPREDKKVITQALSAAGYAVTDGPQLAQIALVVRKPDGTPIDPIFLSRVARSIRPFSVHAILPVGRSIVAVVAEDQALAAIRKLHHDIFEG